jgi:hypothetical protein
MDDGPADRHAKSWEMLRREFPEVRTGISCDVGHAPDELETRVELELEQWLAPNVDLYVLDQRVRAPSAPVHLVLVYSTPMDAARAALEVVTRYQGMLRRRNAPSSHVTFDQVLATHRTLHDLGKPLVEADYHHGLDTWQWVLRLEPDASLPLQVAALFHDVERLSSEAERRIEQHALDYVQFKESHARGGAALVADRLRNLVTPAQLERIAWLVAHHEHTSGDRETALLNDADALSFFSLNARGYLDYYGPAQTKKKVDYTLRRLRPKQRWRLSWMRTPAVVQAMIHAAVRFDDESASRMAQRVARGAQRHAPHNDARRETQGREGKR